MTPVQFDGDAIRTALPPAVGDIDSADKGTGARFNGAKPPMHLVPLQAVAEHCAAKHGPSRALAALYGLAAFQSRTGTGLAFVTGALGGGWAECAQVFGYGERKYKAWNWAKGMPWSVPIACAARHLLAMIDGEETDPESGLPHRGHVYCNIAMLLTYARTYPEGDDRPAKGLL